MKPHNWFVRVYVCVLCIGLAVMVVAQSQRLKGRVELTVLDSAGATLGASRVLLIDLSTLDEKRGEVPVDGRLSFGELDIGEYLAVVIGPKSAPCFVPDTERLRVSGRQTTRVIINLKLDLDKCGEPVE